MSATLKEMDEGTGIEVSERVKIAIERASTAVRKKIFQTLFRLAKERKPSRQDQKFGPKDGVYIARISPELRMVFVIEKNGIVIDDILDHRQYL